MCLGYSVGFVDHFCVCLYWLVFGSSHLPLELGIPELLGWAGGQRHSSSYCGHPDIQEEHQTLQCHSLLFILVYCRGPIPETSVSCFLGIIIYFIFCLKRSQSCLSVFKIGSRWLGDYLWCCFSCFYAFPDFYFYFGGWLTSGCDNLSVIPAKRWLLLDSQEKGWPLGSLSRASPRPCAGWLFFFFFFFFSLFESQPGVNNNYVQTF